jgi:hypothetical protein
MTCATALRLDEGTEHSPGAEPLMVGVRQTRSDSSPLGLSRGQAVVGATWGQRQVGWNRTMPVFLTKSAYKGTGSVLKSR